MYEHIGTNAVTLGTPTLPSVTYVSSYAPGNAKKKAMASQPLEHRSSPVQFRER